MSKKILSFSDKYVQRFWKKVDKHGPTPPHMQHLGRCWNCTAALNREGYGEFGIIGGLVRAHRFSWWLEAGADSTKLVLHKCDNPACVNPAHLFEGTYADNVSDMLEKGRGGKLNGEQVAEILRLAGEGATSLDLASKFSVTRVQINNIRRGACWKAVLGTRRERSNRGRHKTTKPSG